MPINNVSKRIDKAKEKLGLAPHETVLGGCMTDPKSNIGLAVGGVAGAAVQAALSDRSSPPEGGMAADWPKGQRLVGLTSTRLIVCVMTMFTGKPKKILAEWPHSDITGFSIEQKKLSYPFSITFRDGSVARSEGFRGSGADVLGEEAAKIWG